MKEGESFTKDIDKEMQMEKKGEYAVNSYENMTKRERRGGRCIDEMASAYHMVTYAMP